MAVIYALLRVRLNNVQNVFVHQKSNHRRNRHHFSANGPFLLLPLALKWGLFGTFGVMAFLYTPLMITPKTVIAAEVPYITLTVPSSPLDLTVSPDNTLAETSGTDSAKITVSSNTYWGYTLSLTGGTDDGSLTGNNNNKLATFSGDGAIATNTWGYKFKKQNAPNLGDDKWLPGPKKDILSVLDTTAGNSNGTNKEEQSTYEFTLGAKVDTNQPSGQYSNNFTFTATVNAASYTINYDDNDGDGGPDKVTGQTQENVVALSPKEPTKADNIFMGWCDQPTTGKNCNGNRYQSGDEITVSRSDSDLTLYAIWHDNKMQNFDACEYLPMNKQFTLIDSRDNKPYYVAKLADDNCWMTENLDLDIEKGRKYTVEDTDLAYATEDEKNACRESEPSCVEGDNYVWIPDKSTYTTNDTWDTESANRNYYIQSYDPGDYCWDGKLITGSGQLGKNAVPCNKHQEAPGFDPHHHLGNFYNWSAAVAQNDTRRETSYKTSICAAGWQLPDAIGEKSLENLQNVATLTAGTSGNIHQKPYYFTYSGWWRKQLNWLGLMGTYYSSTAGVYLQFFTIHNGNPYIGPDGTGAFRYDGFSVRCVARRN